MFALRRGAFINSSLLGKGYSLAGYADDFSFYMKVRPITTDNPNTNRNIVYGSMSIIFNNSIIISQ